MLIVIARDLISFLLTDYASSQYDSNIMQRDIIVKLYQVILQVATICAIVVLSGCGGVDNNSQCDGVLVNVDGEERCLPSAGYFEDLYQEAPKVEPSW